VTDRDAFVESLKDTHLYTVGAYFLDSNPDLADDVVAQAAEIERIGLERYASREAGLAVRYFRAVNGKPG
jgi:hypothetical protein